MWCVYTYDKQRLPQQRAPIFPSWHFTERAKRVRFGAQSNVCDINTNRRLLDLRSGAKNTLGMIRFYIVSGGGTAKHAHISVTRRRKLSPQIFFYLPPSLWLTCHSEHSQSLESAIFKSCHYTSQVWQKIRKWTTGFNHDRFQVLEIFPEAAPKSWHSLKPLLLWAHVCTLTQPREPHLQSFLLAKHCPW